MTKGIASNKESDVVPNQYNTILDVFLSQVSVGERQDVLGQHTRQ